MVNEMQGVGSSKHTALGKVFLLTSFYHWQGILAKILHHDILCSFDIKFQ